MDSLLDYDQNLLVPPWGSLGRDAVLGCVAAVTKLLLNVLNKTRALNHDTYLDLVMHRPPGVGLLTISNHTRCVAAKIVGRGLQQRTPRVRVRAGACDRHSA